MHISTPLTLSDPPENIELSDLVITLEEGSSADSVMCTAEAYPEASYAWEANGDVVATDNLLFFDKGVSRGQGGDYMCVAKNRHGRAEMVTRIEVICEWVGMRDEYLKYVKEMRSNLRFIDPTSKL